MVQALISIYCYENRINGKVYVGTTENTLEFRSRNGYSGCTKFRNALKKYGMNGFNRWIFRIVDTAEQAAQEEIFWIAEMRKFLGVANVYNLLDGGQGGSRGRIVSQETKEKMSKSGKGRKRSEETKKKIGDGHRGPKSINYGTHLSEERKQWLSEINMGERNHFFGKHHSDETKAVISKAITGKPSPNKGKPMTDEQKEKISKTRRIRGTGVGEKNPKAKLTWKLVEDIRSKHSSGELTIKEIAKIHGVSFQAIYKIVLNKSWKV